MAHTHFPNLDTTVKANRLVKDGFRMRSLNLSPRDGLGAYLAHSPKLMRLTLPEKIWFIPGYFNSMTVSFKQGYICVE